MFLFLLCILLHLENNVKSHLSQSDQSRLAFQTLFNQWTLTD